MRTKFVLGCVALVLLAGCASSPGVGAKAPSFTATDTDGNVISLAAFDDKVLILDFWALW